MRCDDRGEPVALGGSGAALWEALVDPRTRGELASMLAVQFDVPAEHIERDMRPALDDLLERGLVEVRR